MDYTKLTDEELNEVIRCADLEKTARANKRKAKYMEEVKKAIAKYNENCCMLYFIGFDGKRNFFDIDNLVFDTECGAIYLKEDY